MQAIFAVAGPDVATAVLAGPRADRCGGVKKTMARDVYELVRSLGYESAYIAGADIGSMVAFSYAANHPEATRKMALWEPGHPGEAFTELRLLAGPGEPNAWWWAMNQDQNFPEKLFAGRFRMMIDYLIDYQAADPDAISEADRQIYADAYERPGAISAANRWYQAFLQDVADARDYPPLSPPVLALGGRFFPYVRLLMEGRAKNVRYVEFKGAGHYLAEERPEDMIRELSAFFGGA